MYKQIQLPLSDKNIIMVLHTERVRKRTFSDSIIPDTLPETQEVDFFSEITNSNIVRACKRALSGQQTQADSQTIIWFGLDTLVMCC
jgi:hypothetical protein